MSTDVFGNSVYQQETSSIERVVYEIFPHDRDGNIDLGDRKISSAAAPTTDSNMTNKAYVDSMVRGVVAGTGVPHDADGNYDFGNKKLISSTAPTSEYDMANKRYVDERARFPTDRHGDYCFGTRLLHSSAPPLNGNDLTNKEYVDSRIQTSIQEVRLGVEDSLQGYTNVHSTRMDMITNTMESIKQGYDASVLDIAAKINNVTKSVDNVRKRKITGTFVLQTGSEQTEDYEAYAFNRIQSEFTFPFAAKITAIRGSSPEIYFKLDGETMQLPRDVPAGGKLTVYPPNAPAVENFKQLMPQMITITYEYK